MRTLVLMRHAKSSWEYDVSDKERPLKSRGIADAKAISLNFKKYGFYPDMVFSSPANRALTTCHIFLKNMEISYKKLEIVDEIYDFSGHNVMHFVRNLDDDLKNVAIFGHNYAFTSLVNALGSKHIANLPTAGLAMINFPCDSWKDIESGETEVLLIPKEIR